MLVVGADLLVRGGSRLALALNVPVLIVALTIVALGTSMPELLVSVFSATQGSTEMALANVTGSNIANILLVLGVAAMVRPIVLHPELLAREVPTAVGLQIVVLVLLGDGELGRWDGVALLVMGAIYNIMLVIAARKGRVQLDDDESVEAGGTYLTNLLLIGAGVAVMIVGGQFFVRGSIELAKLLGMSERIIGLTVVALGTSAPEVATGVVSSLKGQSDMAVGNSLGSNILNVALVLGVTAIVMPVPLGEGAWMDLLVALGATILLVPILLGMKVMPRWAGAVMLLGYVGYVYSLTMG